MKHFIIAFSMLLTPIQGAITTPILQNEQEESTQYTARVGDEVRFLSIEGGQEKEISVAILSINNNVYNVQTVVKQGNNEETENVNFAPGNLTTIMGNLRVAGVNQISISQQSIEQNGYTLNCAVLEFEDPQSNEEISMWVAVADNGEDFVFPGLVRIEIDSDVVFRLTEIVVFD